MFDKLSFQEFFSVFLVLFAIINIVGNIPILLTLKRNGKKVRPFMACLYSLILFISFLFIGEGFLMLFGLDVSSFAIAGSLIIFIIALEMILEVEIFKSQPDAPKDATFFPVVFPLTAGAGALTTLLSIKSQYSLINIILAIICNLIIVYFVIKLAKNIERTLGKAVIHMLTKFFGIVLLAISVKLFIANVTHLVENMI